VWRVDEATLAVTAVVIEPAPVRTCLLDGWTLVTDDGLLRRLAALRAAKLPNETGGVLLGTYDLARRIVYVVDTVPSPRDSHEYPTSYLRGCAGLPDDVRRIEDATAGQVHYIGEWHSHPAGHRCVPSDDDAALFAWLTTMLEGDGLPPLMMIVGDDGLAVPYLGRLVRDGQYPAALRAASLATE
jgi:proteasome lid subunit RPN8/RPN11